MHWLVKPGALTADDRIHPIIITTVLAGPYADIGSLKSARPALKTLHPVTISTNDRTPSLPASVFSLPADLPPGFYNLTFKFDYGGGNSAGGGSVVQVSSRP